MGRPRKIKAVVKPKTKIKIPKAPKPVKEKKVVKKPKQAANIAFFEKLAKATENDLAQAASNGILSGDITGWIDTGVLLFNGQLSGTIFGGAPNNKIVVFAGPAATGKTFFILALIKHFLDTHKESGVMFFESEGAITKDMMVSRGIDVSRVYVIPIETVQDLRTQSLKMLRVVKNTAEDDRRPLMFVCDSLGMLSTQKEMEDSEEGKATADMTRARLIKSAFRTITLKLGVLGIPFFITNHVYDTQGLFSHKVQSGGSGVSYANSLSVFLSKSKDKVGTEVVGAILHCKLEKGRLTKENTVIDVSLDYGAGLDRYYGLIELGLKYDLFKKVKEGKTEKIRIGGKVATEKVIEAHPEEYFTDEVLKALDVFVGKEFNYGSNIVVEPGAVEE
jgi:RecA/RadA recombinase